MKASLEGVPGVVRASVNLATKEATVEYVPGTVGRPELLRAIDRVDTRLRLGHWIHRLLARVRQGPR